VVIEDELVVDGEALAGEDPRAAAVRDALAEPTPESRADGLRQAGVRLVVVEDVERVAVPEVAGDTVWEDDDLRVVDAGPAVPAPRPADGWVAAMALAWLGWGSLLPVALLRLRQLRRTRRAQLSG
jgi:hypothetical protein